MRVTSKSRNHFHGTHKGCDIQIERETDRELRDEGHRFYIIVTGPSGGHLYDGWTDEDITTMAEAKREALYGSCLKTRPAPDREGV